MLTEKQQEKVKKVSDIYFNTIDSLKDADEELIVQILRKNKWNITNAINAISDYTQSVIKEKERIGNLPINVVRISDADDYHEIWDMFYKCPNCRKSTLMYKVNYCSHCGIKLDWSEFTD